MTLFPNRIGAVRGPNGSTLDDIVDGLTAIAEAQAATNLSLSGIATTQGQILSALLAVQAQVTYIPGFISGSNEPDTLAQFLRWTLGGPGDSFFGLNYALMLDDLLTTLQTIRGEARLYHTLQTNDPVTSPEVAEGFSRASARLLASLSLVTGLAGDPPIGSTIKALLASIDVNQARAADCCEENAGPGDGLNPPPDIANVCDIGTVFFRATGYSGPFTVGNIDVYGLQFDGINTASGGEVVQVLALSPFQDWPILRSVAVDNDFCLTWNLSTGQVPAGGNATRIPVSGDINDGVGTAFNYSLGEGSSALIDRDAGLHLLYEVQMPQGTPPPPLNFWLRWRVQPS